MEKEKPLILVSNDDGVMAKGINELVKFLRPLGEIIAVSYTHLDVYKRQSCTHN